MVNTYTFTSHRIARQLSCLVLVCSVALHHLRIDQSQSFAFVDAGRSVVCCVLSRPLDFRQHSNIGALCPHLKKFYIIFHLEEENFAHFFFKSNSVEFTKIPYRPCATVILHFVLHCAWKSECAAFTVKFETYYFQPINHDHRTHIHTTLNAAK